MTVLSVLLRVLLSISLILNGSGYAMAATHMQMGHGDTAASAPKQASDSVFAAELPCQQHHSGVSGPVAQLPDTTSDSATVKSEHPSPDCCKSGACRCACVHQVQVAIPMGSLDGGVIEHAGVMQLLKQGHTAPALPHLIRPPIG